MELLALLITGALAGWIAGTLIRGKGYGLVINIVIGVIGSILGGKLFGMLGVQANGWLINLAMAVVGAILLLTLVNLARPRGQ